VRGINFRNFQETGHEELYRHIITVNADKITETNAESIPTGQFVNVGGTPFDLRIPRELGPGMAKLTGPGYDDNFCVTKSNDQEMAFVARVGHPPSGRTLEIFCDQPGVQLYTSNFMPDPCNDVRSIRISLNK
jgi:aldose 1-epimerase